MHVKQLIQRIGAQKDSDVTFTDPGASALQFLGRRRICTYMLLVSLYGLDIRGAKSTPEASGLV